MNTETSSSWHLNRDDLPRIRQLVKQSAQSILNNANGEIDSINDYSRKVPAILVQEYLGLDGVCTESLIEWSYWNQYDAFHNQPAFIPLLYAFVPRAGQ